MTNTDVNKFEPGMIVYHRATNEKCVVIEITEDKVRVRTSSNAEDYYYPQELDTEAELNAEAENQRSKIPPGPFDPYGF